MFVLAMVKILPSLKFHSSMVITVYQPNFIQYQLVYLQNKRIFYVERKILIGHRRVASSILVILFGDAVFGD